MTYNLGATLPPCFTLHTLLLPSPGNRRIANRAGSMVSQPLGDAAPVEDVHAPRQDAAALAGLELRPADDARVPDKPGGFYDHLS
jgi:hypothetical protein